MTAYATLAELKDALDITDATDDAGLQRALEAGRKWIDNYTGRKFLADTADVTRVFLPSDPKTLRVPDLRSITSIKVDRNGDRTYSTTLTLASDYELWPFDGPPYTEVRLWPLSSYSFSSYHIQIIGKFGYSTTPPDDIKQANILVAIRYWKRPDAPFGVLSAPELGSFQRAYERIPSLDPDVGFLLNPYRLSGASWVLV